MPLTSLRAGAVSGCEGQRHVESLGWAAGSGRTVMVVTSSARGEGGFEPNVASSGEVSGPGAVSGGTSVFVSRL